MLNGSALSRGPIAEAEAARLALDAAEKGFHTWRKISAYERAKIMRKAAELVRSRIDDIAGSEMRNAVAQNADAAARRFLASIGALHANLALGGFGKAGENAEQSGFASAIAAEQRHRRTGGDLEDDVFKSRKIAVILPYALDFESAQRMRCAPCQGFRAQAAPFRYSSAPPTPRMENASPRIQYSRS